MSRPGDRIQGPAASMTLLSEVYQRPLDPGYQEAVDRRGEGYRRSKTDFGAALVLAVVLGLGVTTAALDLRQPSAAAFEARNLLEQQIADEQQRAIGARAEIRATSAEIDELSETALSEEVLTTLRQDAAESGVSAVAGPGLRVVLSDAPGADGQEQSEIANRVQDVDMQVLVNGLWAVGAEAIAINGHRLTGLTAIRSAGSAILVDMTPLVGPYTVDIVGDPDLLQSGLLASTAGQHLVTLRSTYGIGVQISVESKLTLAGTGQVSLLHAVPLAQGSSDVASSVPEGSDP